MGSLSTPTSMDELLRDRAWIRALARALVRDPEAAEDAEQDAWLTALRRPPAPGPDLRGWWRSVLRSRAADSVRSDQRRRAREAAAQRRVEVPDPQVLVEQAELQGMVARRVAALAEPTRTTVLLHYFQSMGVCEIAEHLDVPVATVRSRLHRAHAVLRAQLDRDLGGPGSCQQGLLLLSLDPRALADRATSAAWKGVASVTTSQKVLVAVGLCLLALGGGALGARLLPRDPEPVARAEVLRAAAPPREPTLPPTLRGAGTSDASSSADLRALRQEVGALRSDLDAVATRFDALDPASLELLRRALPRLIQEGIERNEGFAVAASRNFTSAHAQMQAAARIDRNADGVGEFGGFLEMSGAVPGRMDAVLVPPLLSRRFRQLNHHGELEYGGYLFRIFLPDRRGAGVGEPPEGFSRDGPVDPALAETAWCCYAWPVEYGVTGKRTFCVSQRGDTLSTEDARYSGTGRGPSADAAFLASGILGPVAIGATGQDGNSWQPAN